MNNELIEAAKKARKRAYSLHSSYAVGAAVLGSDGKVYAGCNVENDSYALSMCAERNAVGAMVLGGSTTVAAIAIVTENGAPPCGACRQVLFQFKPLDGDMAVFMVDEQDTVREATLSALFPDGFSL